MWNGKRNRGIQFMETALQEFDKIILIDRDLGDPQLMAVFLEEDNFKGMKKQIMILSEQADKKAGSIEWRKVAEEDADEILGVYSLYEFSNRFAVVAREQAFGSLMNYVDTGMVTREEMLAAVLR